MNKQPCATGTWAHMLRRRRCLQLLQRDTRERASRPDTSVRVRVVGAFIQTVWRLRRCSGKGSSSSPRTQHETGPQTIFCVNLARVAGVRTAVFMTCKVCGPDVWLYMSKKLRCEDSLQSLRYTKWAAHQGDAQATALCEALDIREALSRLSATWGTSW